MSQAKLATHIISTEKPVKAAQLLLRALRREIVAGQFEEGSNLPTEGELMDRFGVSRAPVREAIRVLEVEGLVTTSQGARKGARVNSPSARVAARHTALLLSRRGTSLYDLYVARLAIEPFAAGLLARSATPDKVAQLKALLAKCRSLVETPLAWGEAAHDFHQAVMDLSGNQTLAVFSAQLRDLLKGQTDMEMQEAGDVSDIANRNLADDAHERFIALVERGEADKAEAFWTSHLKAAWPAHRITELLDVDDLLS